MNTPNPAQLALGPRRLSVMKHSFQVAALPAFVLGALTAAVPRLWSLIGLDVGANGVVAMLYSCVLMAVGVWSFLGARRPEAHTGLWLFMGVYKGLAFVVLSLHFWAAGTGPLAGWAIAGIYLFLSIYSLLLYPWRQAL